MDKILSPRLQRIFHDWEEWRRDRELPSRADFSPLDLGYILGNLSLIDVAYNPLRFTYRLHASNLTQRMNKEMTHKSIDDLPAPDHARRVRKHFTEVVERRVPIVYRRSGDDAVLPKDQTLPDCEVLVLPLSSDGKLIDMLMSALVWDRE